LINGTHIVICSRDVEADLAFFKDVLKFDNIDIGNGRLLFKLPPSELGVHESDENDNHELYLMCDDVDTEVARLANAGVACEPVVDRGWGLLTSIALPGGGKLGLYQPRHARP